MFIEATSLYFSARADFHPLYLKNEMSFTYTEDIYVELVNESKTETLGFTKNSNLAHSSSTPKVKAFKQKVQMYNKYL